VAAALSRPGTGWAAMLHRPCMQAAHNHCCTCSVCRQLTRARRKPKRSMQVIMHIDDMQVTINQKVSRCRACTAGIATLAAQPTEQLPGLATMYLNRGNAAELTLPAAAALCCSLTRSLPRSWEWVLVRGRGRCCWLPTSCVSGAAGSSSSSSSSSRQETTSLAQAHSSCHDTCSCNTDVGLSCLLHQL
jgi:hypothetical protein